MRPKKWGFIEEVMIEKQSDCEKRRQYAASEENWCAMFCNLV